MQLQHLKRFESKPKKVELLNPTLRIPFAASPEAKLAAAKLIRLI